MSTKTKPQKKLKCQRTLELPLMIALCAVMMQQSLLRSLNGRKMCAVCVCVYTCCVEQTVHSLCGPATVHAGRRAPPAEAAGDTMTGSAHRSPTAPEPPTSSSTHQGRTPDRQSVDQDPSTHIPLFHRHGTRTKH